MPTQEYAASIQGVSIRVTRLDASGNLLNNPGDSYTTSAFMRVSFTPEYEEGDEITEKNANGVVCVTYKSPDTLKRITMELAICEPDAELTNLISGGLLLRKNFGTFAAPDNKSIGWASPGVGDDPAGYGVAIECWSNAIKNGKKSTTLPYFQWVFPFVKMRQSGDRVIENGMLATTFEGYGLGNPAYGSGVDGRWEFPVAAERPYSYARTTWAPTGLNGFYTWSTPDDTLTISNSARAGNVATITTVQTHNLTAGVLVTVSGTNGNAPLHGTYTVTGVNASAKTFTYVTPTSGTITSGVDTGLVLVKNGDYVPVTDFSGQTSTTAYNVPGNVGFNADATIDRIIASNEDPTV